LLDFGKLIGHIGAPPIAINLLQADDVSLANGLYCASKVVAIVGPQ
jgi:hypothetical protein